MNLKQTELLEKGLDQLSNLEKIEISQALCQGQREVELPGRKLKLASCEGHTQTYRVA